MANNSPFLRMAAKFNIEGISLGSLCLENAVQSRRAREGERGEERCFNSASESPFSQSQEFICRRGSGSQNPPPPRARLLLA